MRLVRSIIRLVVVALVAFVAVGAAQDAGFRLPTSLEDLQHPEELFSGELFTGVLEGTSGAAVPSVDPGNYSFISTDSSGAPARYNPCAPIRYTVNLSHAPAGALEDVHGAFARLAAATGLQFEYVGETSQVPTESWYASGSGSAYPPVNVAWVKPGESSLLTSGASGNGGSDFLSTGSGKVFVTGSVVLNADHNDMYQAGFGDGMTRGNLLVHELGHVLGLGHAPAPGAVMYGQISSSTPGELAAGDLAGLASLGSSAGCLPTLTR